VLFITDRNDEGGSNWETRFGSKLLVNWTLTGGIVNFLDFPNREFGQPYDKRFVSLNPDKEVRGTDNCAKFVLDTAKNETKKAALVFTHGYNNTFSDTLSRAKGFADDTDYTGILIVWSWPSQGGVTFYSQDEKAAAWSGQHFAEFLRTLISSRDVTFDFVAHSMGNHLLLSFVQAMKAQNSMLGAKALIFAAPDVDQSEFKQKASVSYSHFYTLYASTDDWALRMSVHYHGSDGLRAGTGGQDKILLMQGLESVDANVTGHSYVYDDPRAMTDVELLLQTHSHAGARGLASRQRDTFTYWILNP